ncbi:unnamed protein product [Tuber aestivum]|uniref:Uncharacterized protein n=1 Tax=Tuber aestivum TaxID=59557 RepID=A0A292PKI1_9PEZI|nr:unnamed protein product [Tuber aestivum]
MAIPTPHPLPSALHRTVTVTSFINFNLSSSAPTFPRTVTVTSFICVNPSAPAPTYGPLEASTTAYFGLCDPPGPWGRTYACYTNTELVPLRSSEKSFLGTLGRAKTLPYRFDTLGPKPGPSRLDPRAKAAILAQTLSSGRTTATRSTDEEVVTGLPAHTASITPSLTYSIPVTTVSPAATVPHPYAALFLQAPVVLAFLGIFLLFCGFLWRFRVHQILSQVILWLWRQIRQFLKDRFSRGNGRDTTIGPSVEAPEFLGTEKHRQGRLNSYLGSNSSTAVELREDDDEVFQADSGESREGDTATLVPSLELNPGGENHGDDIEESNSALNVRPRPSGNLSCNSVREIGPAG